MIIRSLVKAEPFTTKDGSTIRSLLDLTTAPVQGQSLAEATLPPGGATTRHKHAKTEEFYFIVDGEGRMDLDGELAKVGPGDAILIPAGSAHQISNIGTSPLRLLCCCAPPYSHEDTQLLD